MHIHWVFDQCGKPVPTHWLEMAKTAARRAYRQERPLPDRRRSTRTSAASGGPSVGDFLPLRHQAQTLTGATQRLAPSIHVSVSGRRSPRVKSPDDARATADPPSADVHALRPGAQDLQIRPQPSRHGPTSRLLATAGIVCGMNLLRGTSEGAYELLRRPTAADPSHQRPALQQPGHDLEIWNRMTHEDAPGSTSPARPVYDGSMHLTRLVLEFWRAGGGPARSATIRNDRSASFCTATTTSCRQIGPTTD